MAGRDSQLPFGVAAVLMLWLTFGAHHVSTRHLKLMQSTLADVMSTNVSALRHGSVWQQQQQQRAFRPRFNKFSFCSRKDSKRGTWSVSEIILSCHTYYKGF